MDWLSTKLDNLLVWFATAFQTFFTALGSYLQDFAVWLLDSVLTAISALLSAIPVPAFMNAGLTGLFSALPQPLVYLLVATGFVQGLAVVGAGVLFNLTRKLLTLGQW